MEVGPRSYNIKSTVMKKAQRKTVRAIFDRVEELSFEDIKDSEILKTLLKA